MGNALNVRAKINGLLYKAKTAHSEIGQMSFCPNCQKQFPKTTTYQTFATHVELCLTTPSKKQSNKVQRFYEVYIRNDACSRGSINTPNEEQRNWTKYLVNFDSYLMNLKPQQVYSLNIAEKIVWFQHHLEERKIDWKKGAEYLMFSPNNIVVDSLLILKLNLFKELKLTVVDDIVKDAGGLLRQWSVLLFKELIQNHGLFTMNKQGYYQLNSLKGQNIDDLYELVGALLAKIILQKITIPFHFDQTFIAQLTGTKLELQHVQSFDKDLYNSWKDILEEEKIEEFQMTFSILNEKGVQELIDNGKEVKVTNENKDFFIEKCINSYCVERNQRQMSLIKKQFNRYIPENYISILKPLEIEMILNGMDSEKIDPEEWKKGTEYREPFKQNHQVIQWFWNCVELMNSKERSALLKFVTGSQNLPIFGFKHLQTNRGNTSCFMIESSAYDKKQPFPKAHTCFNRLILPMYPNQQTLREALLAVVRCEFDGVWGLQ